MFAFPSSSYALGILFLVIVSLLWTVCSMVVQHLYHDMQFDSPFLIVYIGTSLFSVFLPIRLGYERWGRCLADSCSVYAECCGCCDGGEGGKDIVRIPWRNEPPTISTAFEDEEGLVQSEHDSLHNGTAINVEMHSIPQYTPETAEEGHVDGYSFDNEYCAHNYEPNDPSQNDGRLRSNGQNNASYLLSHRDHISMASKVAPLWFFSNYFYAMSLEWTSIASSTVLASMGSIFAFGFATCSRFGDERITKAKMLGVALCFLGGVATTWTDVGVDNGSGGDSETEDLRHLRYLRHPASHLPHIFNLDDDSPIRSLLGDLAGLLSAVGYGAYTVLLRHLCPKDEDRFSMQLLFGYIGVWNLVILLPVAIWVMVSSNDDADAQGETQASSYDGSSHGVHTTLTWSIFLFLLLKGLLDNVLSDYLWARAVILTSATVASVGVGLTVPMAFAADWIMGNHNATQAGEVLGAIFVLVGFVFVNIDGERGSAEEEEDAEEVTFEEDALGTHHSAHDVDAEILS